MAKIRWLIEPKYLYRYRSVSTAKKKKEEIGAIRDGYLWCSCFTDMNDPMEGAFEASILLQKDPRIREIKSQIINKKTNLGICSLSEAHDHELMWAHYADQFRGICIEYYVPRLLEALSEDIELAKVSYSEQNYRVFPKTASDSDTAKRILSTKNHRWFYEREWRLLSPSKGRINLARNTSIRTVFFGSRMPESTKDRLMMSIREKLPDVRFKEASIDGYRMKFANCLKESPTSDSL